MLTSCSEPLCAQHAEALVELNALGVLHQDQKLANVLVTVVHEGGAASAPKLSYQLADLGGSAFSITTGYLLNSTAS
jgi:hypothetical protein